MDLGAPGLEISSTHFNGGYATLSGTSMAAPHVSGALAVYWDANPNATYSQLIQRLKDTVDPLPELSGKTVRGGRLNLNSLLSDSSQPPASGGSASFTGSDVTTQGWWRGTYGADGHVLSQVASSLPACGSATVVGQLDYTWAGSTADGRALQKPDPASPYTPIDNCSVLRDTDKAIEVEHEGEVMRFALRTSQTVGIINEDRRALRSVSRIGYLSRKV